MSKKLEKMKESYEEIKIPEDLRERVEAGMTKGKKELKKEESKKNWKYIGSGLVAALFAITLMANMGGEIAHAMEKIPVIGAVAKVVTFREYTHEEEKMEANIKIPDVVVEDEEGEVLEESTEQINKSIEEYTDEIIRKYEEDVKESGGEANELVNLEYKVITDSDKLFSIRFDQLVIMASGAQFVKIYHIDKTTGELLQLDGLFEEKANYQEIISENIKDQMRTKMKEDDMNIYWIDSDMPDMDFQSIEEDETFYISDSGKLTIVFDEYEAGPGYMGVIEFEIPTIVVEDIVKPGILK